jgi:predicted esterase
MRQSPEFECLGSVLNETYQDLFLGAAPTGHYYEYIPEGPSQSLPVVLFLHGSLGNFKSYLWVWKQMAQQYGFAVVSPTFGAGNWDEAGGEDVIEQAHRYCASHPRLDATRIYLAGLSNGGRGVSLAASRSPDAYRGLIYISPILEPEILLRGSFVAAWKDKPILILHGADDNRVPIDYIREGVDTLKSKGLRVETEFYDNQTHFLFFTIRDQVRVRIGNWLTKEWGS